MKQKRTHQHCTASRHFADGFSSRLCQQFDSICCEPLMSMRPRQNLQRAVLRKAIIEMQSNGQDLRHQFCWRLYALNSGLLSPGMKPRHVMSSLNSNRKILVPEHAPVGTFCFIDPSVLSCIPIIPLVSLQGSANSLINQGLVVNYIEVPQFSNRPR